MNDHKSVGAASAESAPTSPADVRFSIVTVSFNAARTVEAAIRSVNAQDHPGFLEHIFVDGGSSDATVATIQSLATREPRVTSGPDKGIYDAMNKGVAMAQGDWIFFLNADDAFRDPEVLRDVAEVVARDPGLELVYGKTVATREGRRVGIRGRPIRSSDYWYPMLCMGHQGVFCRKDLFHRLGGFEVGLAGGISDFAWLARYFAQVGEPRRFAFLDREIAFFSEGGYSFVHAWSAHLSELRWVRRNLPLASLLRHLMRTPLVFLLVKVLQVQRETRIKKLLRAVRNTIDPRRCDA